MLKRLLGLLGWLGVALVLVAFAIWILRPQWQEWRIGLAYAGLACTLLYIISQWREIGRAFSGRQARYGTLSLASIVAVIAILAAINYLASRHSKRWDLTAAKQFTLADQTKKVLQSLDQPLRVIVFARTEDFDRFRQRLDEYQYHSKQFQVEYVDPERRPLVAQPYLPLVESGTVVFERGKQIERANSDTEQALTNALVKVVQGAQSKVYFIQGHDERAVDNSSERTGYGTVGQYLISDNFAHGNLVLSQVRAIPDDATVLVVAGPKMDFFPNEIDLLKGYLAKGGKVLFLLDPPDAPDAPPLTNLSALLKEWAIEIGNNVVINVPSDYQAKEGEAIDISALGALPNTDGTYVLAAKYMPHQMMEGINRVTVFRVARTITANTDGSGGRYAQGLIESTATSWAETDLKRLFGAAQVAREPGKGDKDGPLTIAAAVSAPASDSGTAPAPEGAAPDATKNDAPRRETRLVVIGDSDFASNMMLGAGRNVDLFMNAINWLAQREEMIAIRPRDPEDRRITLTAQQERWIFFLTVLIIPGIILAAGVQTWWRRR